MSKRDILVFLFKWKWSIGSVFLGVVAVVTLLVYLLPPGYTASAKILVERGKSPSLRTELQPGQEMSEVINTEIAIVTSRTVMRNVVDRLKLHDLPSRDTTLSRFTRTVRAKMEAAALLDPVDARERWISSLLKSVKVKPVLDTNAFTIKFGNQNPRLAAEIVNAVVDEYLALHVRIYSSTGAVEFYLTNTERAKSELSRLQKEMSQYKEKASLAAIPSKKTGLVNEMKDLNERLSILNLELVEAMTKFDHQHPKVALLRKKITTVEGEVEPIRRQLQGLEGGESKVEEQAKLIRLQEETYRTYKGQLDQAMLNTLGDRTMVNVHVVDQAEVPARPPLPRLFYILVAILGGGMLSLGIALIREYYDHRVSTPALAERILGVPVFGSVRYGRSE